MTIRIASTGALATALVALAAGPVLAHVEPDPSTVKPGKTTTVEFVVEEGCGESPTVKLTFRVPKRAKDATPVEKAGWTATSSGREIVFEGGPSPSAEESDAFTISFTAPKKKGELVWKVVQECEEGISRWIDTSEGADNPRRSSAWARRWARTRTITRAALPQRQPRAARSFARFSVITAT